ncbi:competence/damage-inducible protein A [Bacillus horti]|nr:competence/damage-inducible protein A [Bacillus horti]
MRAEIIAIGTELLLGQIVNTNAQFLSEQLAALGIPVYYHSVVGDNPERLKKQIEISAERSSLLIFTGGLGPTKDDLTKETLAEFVNRKLVLDEAAMNSITQFFSERNVTMTENNKRQAIVLEGSHVLHNETGLAPGMAFQEDETLYMLLPGPPKELRPMFIHFGIPYLSTFLPEKKVVHSKVMRFCGIGESALETELLDLIDQQTSPTIAPLAKDGEVTLRLTSYAKSVSEAEQEMEELVAEIQSRVGPFLYGWNEESLEQVAVNKLQVKGYTVAFAESCTGGLLSSFITRAEGASKVFQGSVVCYSNEIKNRQLNVPQIVLDKEGAVSEKTASIMAQEIRKLYHSDVGISITGVAGPTTQEDKPIGLVFVGFALPDRTFVKELRLGGQRDSIQIRAAKQALYTLIRELDSEQ